MTAEEVIRVKVFKADGSPIDDYEVSPDRWLLFGRKEGRDWLQELDEPGARHPLTAEFSDLLDRTFTHVVLPDTPAQARDREGHLKVQDGAPALEFLTSSRSAALIHGPAGWWFINPSENTTLDVRQWGAPRSALRPRGDRLLLQDVPVAAWVPSQLGAPHRIQISRLTPRRPVAYGAGQRTRRLEHRLTDANKRALIFFFEEFLRWDPPVRDPRITAYATDRIRALREAGTPAPRASKLRDIFKSVAERDSQREMWLFPTNAEVSAHLWTLQFAIDTGELTYGDVKATLDTFDQADLAWRHILAEQVSRYEHSIAQALSSDDWWQRASDAERGALLNRVGRLVQFALDKREVTKSTPETFLDSLSGLSIQDLQTALTGDGRVTLPAEHVLDGRDIDLVGELRLAC